MKSKSNKSWKTEIARDFIALGSIPFFILVLVRIYILSQPAYFSQVAIAGALFLIFAYILKGNIYSGLALIAGFFLSNHYNDIKFTIFAIIAYLLLGASLFYLKESKKRIFLGAVLGIISSIIGYYLTKGIF